MTLRDLFDEVELQGCIIVSKIINGDEVVELGRYNLDMVSVSAIHPDYMNMQVRYMYPIDDAIEIEVEKVK